MEPHEVRSELKSIVAFALLALALALIFWQFEFFSNPSRKIFSIMLIIGMVLGDLWWIRRRQKKKR